MSVNTYEVVQPIDTKDDDILIATATELERLRLELLGIPTAVEI